MAQAEQLFPVRMRGIGDSVDVLQPNQDRLGIHMQNVGATTIHFSPIGDAEEGGSFTLNAGDTLTLEGYACPRAKTARASGEAGGVLLVFETAAA